MRVEKIGLPSAGYGTVAATLTAYVQDNVADQAGCRRPGVVVCPGGGYAFCSDREAEPIALVRSRADEWRVDEKSVGLLGCSAGAHLCATYTALARDEGFLAVAGVSAEEARTAWQILCYPVIDLDSGWPPDAAYAARVCPEGSPLRRAQDLVSPATPPTFLWHTAVDATVPVRNAYLYAQALAAHGVDHECHVFHEGRHGLSLATKQTAHRPGDAVPHVARWLDLALEWLSELSGRTYSASTSCSG